MGFKEYLTVIRGRWYIFLPLVVVVMMSHLLWVVYGQPQLYRATTMIVINPPITGSDFPLARPITPVNRLEAFREFPILNAAVQLLTGERTFTSKVFEDPQRKAFLERCVETFSSNVSGGDVQGLLGEIEGATLVTVSKDERLLTVHATSPSPDRAVAFSWAVAEAGRLFHNEHCREKVAKTVAELQLQRQDFEKERELVQRDRTEFAKRTGFTNFPRYQEMVQGIILAIDGEISQLRGQQRETERMIDERVARSQQGGDEIQAVAAELGESARLKALNEELLKARLEHDLSSSRLTDIHPKLSDLTARIERVERLIAQEQEAIVADGLKKWSTATRDLVKQGAAVALKLDVLKERKASLSRELFKLAEINQEYSRIEERGAMVVSNIERVKGHINELEWAGLQAQGQVQLHSPSEKAKVVPKRGAGVGPLTLSGLMAVIFAMGVLYMLEYIDTRVKTQEDVRRYLGLPLLEMIPYQRRHLITDDEWKGVVAERFNTAATLIRSSARELGMKAFVVSSAVAGEGKTTVSVKLAAALARKGDRVILVDGDLRSPRIHELLGLENRVGLSTLLEYRLDGQQAEGEETGSETLGVPGALNPTNVENLQVLTSGPPVDSPVPLLESERMKRVVGELAVSADFVIFDSPPVNVVGDALALAEVVDGCILVVGSGLCHQHHVLWAKHLLSNVQANLLGVFLNRSVGAGEDYDSYLRSVSEERGRVPVPV